MGSGRANGIEFNAVTIACPDCGLVEDLPPLTPRSRAICRLCRGDLELHDGRSIAAALACSLSGFLLLVPANLLPLVRLHLFGLNRENTIFGGIWALWSHGWVLLSVLAGAFALVLPFLRFGLLAGVLATLKIGHRAKWLGRAFRWANRLDIWAMPDVFLLGAFVGYYRLIHVNALDVRTASGGFLFIAAALLAMLTRAVVDRRTVWRAIAPETQVAPGEAVLSCVHCDLVLPLSRAGEVCPRCAARLHARKPAAMSRTLALLSAAFLLFFPANILPMNVSTQMGTHVSYTIFHGVRALFNAGLWPLGCLIFCTSILIPIGKILVGFWCVQSVWWHSANHLVVKTKLFRLSAELGRWSQTDPFVIVFYVPLMNFGTFASADAAWGATAFMLMTVLTLIATDVFDPRLMWDVAEGQLR